MAHESKGEGEGAGEGVPAARIHHVDPYRLGKKVTQGVGGQKHSAALSWGHRQGGQRLGLE